MMLGSLDMLDRRNNEFQAPKEGVKPMFLKNWEKFILESDHVDVVQEWRHSTVEGDVPQHSYVSAAQSKNDDINIYNMDMNVADRNCNELDIYLAHHGAANFNQMV